MLHSKLYHLPNNYTKNNLTSSFHHLLRRALLFSTATIENPSPKTHFMVEYLIKSCGFSLDKAIKTSTQLAHLKSPKNPDSVLRFLKDHGFDETHLETLFSLKPRFLCCKVEKTLEPKIRVLQGLGFSGSELTRLILVNPSVLQLRNVQPRIEFWRNFFGSDDKLLKAVTRNQRLFSFDIDKKIAPNMSLLREFGVSDPGIVMIGLNQPRLLTKSTATLKALIKRTIEMGPFGGSKMIVHALCALCAMNKTTFDAKLELMKSFGWSELEFLSAFRAAPNFVSISEKKVRLVMDYLVGEVGCDPSYIVRRPRLLMYSFEKRVIPRCRVLRILKSKDLPGAGRDLYSTMALSEKRFLEIVVLPHKERVPELHEAYIDAYAGRSSSETG